MAASLSGVYNLQNFTDLGVLAAGYRLYTYAAGTTTQKTAYTDQAGTVPHTYTSDGGGGQYIALNSRGELPAPLFLTSGGYDIALKTAAGSTVWTRRAIASADVGTDVLTQLADGTSATAGAALLAYNPAKSYASGIGQFLNYTFARTAAEIAAGVTPTNYAYQPGDVRRYGAVGDGVTDDTIAIKNAIQCASDGGQVIIPAATYKVSTIDATPAGSVTIWGFGARLVNSTQVYTAGTPILRINGTSSKDINVIGLECVGPRASASTNVGVGTFGTTDYPSGLCIATARNALIYKVRSNGTYYIGVEAHYVDKLDIVGCDVRNHGYGGIMFTDCNTVNVEANRVHDIGSVVPTDGYGISSLTSYNTPSFPTYNGTVTIHGNHVTSCKRKCIDVHSGIDGVITDNHCKGFGYQGIYAVCEDAAKRVGNWTIANNHVFGDTGFVASSLAEPIAVGSFGPNVTDVTTFAVRGNKIIDCVGATAAIGVNNNPDAAKYSRSIKINDNEIVGGSFVNAVAFNNNGSVYQAVEVNGNLMNTTLSGAVLVLQQFSQATVRANTFKGTATKFLSADATLGLNASGNTLNGQSTLDFNSNGVEYNSIQELSGSLANLDLLKADLGSNNDCSFVADVEVLVNRSSNSGMERYRTIVYGTRVGAAAPSFTPAAASNMAVEGGGIFGTVTAPKLQLVVSGNSATLQFQPQQTFASYRIRVRAQTWRAVVSAP